MPVITIPGLELRIPAMETGLESLKFIPSWKVDAYLSEFLSKNISAILSGEQSPMLSCDEGDGIQTSIGHKGMEPKDLANMITMKAAHECYMDYHPIYPQFHHLSDWLKAIYSGDYQEFLRKIEKVKADPVDKVEDLLNFRESMLRINAIFHVVIGARSLAVPTTEQAEIQKIARKNLNVKNEHLKILDKLLSLGVDVNVRDYAGWTPLHHCFTRYFNEVTFKMAEKLIKAGADVNAKNRFGDTPLKIHIGLKQEGIDAAQSIRHISLLLRHGASPKIKNNCGFSAFTSSAGGCGPISYTSFRQMYCNETTLQTHRKKIEAQMIEDEEFETEDEKNACGNCGKSGKSNKRCTGCYTVWYCSRDCQVKKWKQHGKICKEVQAKVSQKIQQWEENKN